MKAKAPMPGYNQKATQTPVKKAPAKPKMNLAKLKELAKKPMKK